MADTKAPIESKVYGGTIGTGAGAVISAFVVWLLGVTVWGAPPDSPGATEALAAVPSPVAAIVGLLITVGGSFVGGYLARHTPRPETTEALDRIEEAEADELPHHDLADTYHRARRDETDPILGENA
jgi:hypothetical protein